MKRLLQWGKVVPTAATVAVVGGWSAPAQAFFPSYLPDILNDPVTTVPPVVVPPPPFPISPPVTPVPPPPFVPPPVVPPVVPPPPPNVPNEVPPVPPTCSCHPNTPNETPEPATLISGLIGLGVAGAARGKRRLWKS